MLKTCYSRNYKNHSANNVQITVTKSLALFIIKQQYYVAADIFGETMSAFYQ